MIKGWEFRRELQGGSTVPLFTPPSYFVTHIIIMSGYTVIGWLFAVVVASVIFWFFAPKENRTVWRSSVILTLAMCYLMWAITYLCQLHPLVVPRRSDLRPEYAEPE